MSVADSLKNSGGAIAPPCPPRNPPLITFDFMLLKNESERAKIVLKDGYPLDLDFYPQLKKLIMISKTIPVSTATVERSFSAMNRTFSWARSSLDSLEQVI